MRYVACTCWLFESSCLTFQSSHWTRLQYISTGRQIQYVDGKQVLLLYIIYLLSDMIRRRYVVLMLRRSLKPGVHVPKSPPGYLFGKI